MKQVAAAAVLSLLVTACATADLTQAGRRVALVSNAPSGACENLGTLIGQGGGAFGGAYISNDKLIEYAYNDLKNKAAEKRATHLHAHAPQLGGTEGTTTTATISAIAYRCEGVAIPLGSVFDRPASPRS